MVLNYGGSEANLSAPQEILWLLVAWPQGLHYIPKSAATRDGAVVGTIQHRHGSSTTYVSGVEDGGSHRLLHLAACIPSTDK